MWLPFYVPLFTGFAFVYAKQSYVVNMKYKVKNDIRHQLHKTLRPQMAETNKIIQFLKRTNLYVQISS